MTKTQAIQELRRSNASVPVPSRKQRKGRSRSGRKNNAMKFERNAG